MASGSSLLGQAIQLSVQSKMYLFESNKHKQEMQVAQKELESAARRRDEVAVMTAARKQINARRMHEMCARLSVDINQAASMIKMAAATKKITGSLESITRQLTNAAESMDSVGVERSLSDFNAAMQHSTHTTGQLESALGALSCSSADEEVRQLVQKASDIAGIELCAQFVRPPTVIPEYFVDDDELMADCRPQTDVSSV